MADARLERLARGDRLDDSRSVSSPTPSQSRVRRSLRSKTAITSSGRPTSSTAADSTRRQQVVVVDRVDRGGRQVARDEGQRAACSGCRSPSPFARIAKMAVVAPWRIAVPSPRTSHSPSPLCESACRYSTFSTSAKPAPTAKPRIAASTRKPTRPRRSRTTIQRALSASSHGRCHVAREAARETRVGRVEEPGVELRPDERRRGAGDERREHRRSASSLKLSSRTSSPREQQDRQQRDSEVHRRRFYPRATRLAAGRVGPTRQVSGPPTAGS